MDLGQKRYRLVQIVLSMPGVVGLFLPFTGNASPLLGIRNFSWDESIWYLIISTLMAVVILGWQAQRLAFTPISPLGQKALTWLALVAALLPMSVILISVIPGGLSSLDFHRVAAITGCVMCAALSTSLFVGYYRNQEKSVDRLESLLHSSPLIVYTYWLIRIIPTFPGGWEVGTYVIFLAACCYIFMIVLMWKKFSAQRVICQ